jgi:protein kinase-like protein
MRLVPGESFGRYRIEAELGRGGQAVVYRATQLDLDRQVALKVFDEGYLTRAGALERFRREAIASGRLEHPRIVPVYDAGEIEGRAFISMRLVHGDTLAHRISRSGALAPDEAIAALTDIADALDYAHSLGTVHRDVKPGNILLELDGRAYLSDFGLVRLDDMPGLTRRGDWLGTAEYVSPEQVEGESATPRSDIYALTAVAFEALTGRAPFLRREPSAILLAHVRDPVPDASVIETDLPPATDVALARGLSKVPAERPSSAGALVESLRQALGELASPTEVGAALPAALPVPDPVPLPEPLSAAPPRDDPWRAALRRFRRRKPADEEEIGASAERPTEALGGVRRGGLTMGRDVATALVIVALVLIAGAGVIGWIVGNSSADVSGAEQRGFLAGQQEGRDEGYSTGFTRGRQQGVAAGRKAGLAQGRREGRASGLTTGRRQGLEQGRAAGLSEGRAAGLSEGRSTALNGLSSGSWYLVRIGEDGDGPVVESSEVVESDSGRCFTVIEDRVLSGEC